MNSLWQALLKLWRWTSDTFRGQKKAPSRATTLAQPQVTSQQATYQYDSDGRLISVTFSNGAKITYTYDADGNRKTVVATPATP